MTQNGKSALVTGGANGIGQAAVRDAAVSIMGGPFFLAASVVGRGHWPPVIT